MKIASPAFEHNQTIPRRYTCQDEDTSPKLIFNDIPNGTKSLALIMDDPDAPSGTFDHWIAWNLPPDTLVLEEGIELDHEGKNGFGTTGYKGPCPPPGKPHRYFFKLYALDTLINLPNGSSKKQLENAMEGHVIARAELIGTFSR